MNAGALVVAAAGNENVDACNTSPARAAEIITVGASDQNDARASFSNYGSCLDLFAPGVMIPAAWYTATTDLAYMDGTSSATPAVAGAAALMLQHYPSITARALRDSILNHATKSVITGSLSAKNHLLYSLEANDGAVLTPTPTPVPVNTPPTASFIPSCSNLACTFADRSTDVDGSIVAWRWEFGNGVTSTLQNPNYSYPAAGSYTVRLTVTDNNGATSTASGVLTVQAPVAVNLAPVASFTRSCTDLVCTFQDQSYDNDGSIVSWRWEFGNGVTSTTRSPSYTYPAAGTYTVRLTVTDNAGTTGTATSAVTVTAPAAPPTTPPATTAISLSVSVAKSRGSYNTTLRWSGATTSTVDIYRNNAKIRTVSNSGSYTETLPRGTYTYRVCNAGSTTCSVNRSISF
jgi:PKD repeat protein